MVGLLWPLPHTFDCGRRPGRNLSGWRLCHLPFGSGATFTDNYYYGIRRFPYSRSRVLAPNGKPFNPVTFADLDFAQINALADGAFPPSPVIGNTANEVHNIDRSGAALLECAPA